MLLSSGVGLGGVGLVTAASLLGHTKSQSEKSKPDPPAIDDETPAIDKETLADSIERTQQDEWMEKRSEITRAFKRSIEDQLIRNYSGSLRGRAMKAYQQSKEDTTYKIEEDGDFIEYNQIIVHIAKGLEKSLGLNSGTFLENFLQKYPDLISPYEADVITRFLQRNEVRYNITLMEERLDQVREVAREVVSRFKHYAGIYQFQRLMHPGHRAQ